MSPEPAKNKDIQRKPTAAPASGASPPNPDVPTPRQADSAASPSDNQLSGLPDFSGLSPEAAQNSIQLLNDVELDVKIELGRTEMSVEKILSLTNGSVVELDKLAGDPVDILVNEQLIARGEVLVVNDNFCIRINEIVKGISEKVASIAEE